MLKVTSSHPINVKASEAGQVKARFGSEKLHSSIETPEIFHQRINTDINFDLIFTRDSLNVENPVLSSVLKGSASNKVMVFIDSGVAKAFPHIIHKISTYLHYYGFSCPLAPLVYPGGEKVKDGWHYVRDMMDRLLEAHLCRHSFCIAVGGGALLDAAGFAASMVHRGIRLIRMPTTALSQDDSGVGVKNGINYNGVKNIIGAFAAPYAVINDFDFLRTLDARVIGDGVAEAFKVAIIKDSEFFGYLEAYAREIKGCTWPVIEAVVKRAAILHLDHIGKGGDPMERGAARPLDFGHWSAHKLEAMSGYEISHGHGVAVGIALDSVIACMLGYITVTERDRIISALSTAGLPIFTRMLEKRNVRGSLEVLQGIEEFREHLGGSLCITMPKGIGDRIEIYELRHSLVENAIVFLNGLDANKK